MPLNEELLSKFTQNEKGDLYFEDKLIVKRDIIAPGPISNPRVLSDTGTTMTITWDPSVSEDVEFYYVMMANREPVKTTVNQATLTDLRPFGEYEIGIVAVDGSDNLSETKWFYGMTGEAPVPPILDNADIQWGYDGYILDIWFLNFIGATSIDLYINDEFETTLPKGRTSYSIRGATRPNVYNIKAVAKNDYGVANPMLTTIVL
ncbi:fibronectin type III domain-containing protein [Cytobacillus horneckiae]|uniref:fibronectin type III domain-containing protein n=1 Tax=Cytobacillus horneckiae TaxID=549687 RepID=UPI0034CD59A2